LSKLACLLLAAGEAKRFGSDKRLAKLSNNKALIEQSLEKLLALHIPIYIGVKQTDLALVKQLQAQYGLNSDQFISIPCAQNTEQAGIGHSLSHCIKSLDSEHDIDWLMIALADMPYIQSETLSLLVAQAKKLSKHSQYASIHPCSAEGKWGNPLLIHHQVFASFKQLKGDKGGKRLLKPLPSASVCVPDLGIFQDIDSPNDIR